MSQFEYERLIITAASADFGASLQALLGSVTLNWPAHPPVLVYDLGMDDATKARLAQCGIPVRQVPAFCPHWRQHFSWKIWCLHDAPSRHVLWIDAGITVLHPLDDIFQAIESLGYFLVPNYEMLDYEASPAACEACRVPYDFRLGKATLAGGLLGFRKEGETEALVAEALDVVMDEAAMAATDVAHRHDQAVLSLLMYRTFGQVVMGDGQVYLGGFSPAQVPGQKIWVHRRGMLPKDQEHYAAHINVPGNPYKPAPPVPLDRARANYALYKTHWWYGLGYETEALASLRNAFQLDPALKSDIDGFLRWLSWSQNNLARFNTAPEKFFEFGFWVADHLLDMVSGDFRRKAGGWLHMQAAFREFQAGRLSAARRHVVHSFLIDPTLLRNRGLLSILVKSVRQNQQRSGTSQ